MLNPMTADKLKRLDAQYGQNVKAARSHKSCLKVFYGWAKINKVRKREAISIIYENEELARSDTRRSGKLLAKLQETCYERYQTDAEASDAKASNRMFTEYSIFLDDKRIKGSLEKALEQNSLDDQKNVSKEERKKIADALRQHFLITHPDYQEPERQLELVF